VHPVIFKFGKLVVYSYSLMVVAAFCLMVLYGVLEARRVKEDPEKAIDIGILMFIASFIGARILHCLINYPIYLHDPLRILKIWEGGLIYYGGLAGALAAGTIYVFHQHLSWPKWADIVAPTAMIALAVGRVGCFLNGCCYGTIAPQWLPWKVTYPAAAMPLHFAGIPLHPAPIYESITTAIIFLFLAFRARHKRFQGEIFWLMVALYALARIFLEIFRADPRGEINFLHLSTSQVISILLIFISGYILGMNYLRPGVQGQRS